MSEKYWKRPRFQVGRPKKFKTPRDLWDAAVKYFDWVIDTPILEEKAFAHQGDITLTSVAKARPMLIERLCSFIELDYSNYTRYRKDEKFKPVCDHIDAIIRAQKFEGAAAGIFNASIISRDLGLKENMDHSSDDGTMSPKESNTTVIAATKEDLLSVLDMI